MVNINIKSSRNASRCVILYNSQNSTHNKARHGNARGGYTHKIKKNHIVEKHRTKQQLVLSNAAAPQGAGLIKYQQHLKMTVYYNATNKLTDTNLNSIYCHVY
jgi:hypothetical protein